MANSDLHRKRRAAYEMFDFKRQRVASSRVWWYESPSGVEVIIWAGGMPTNALIPWKAIRSALARKDKEASDHATD